MNEGLQVPARTVPVPTTISPEAQAFLSRDFGIMPPEIPHTDKAAWRAYVTAVEAQILQMSAMRARAFPAKISEHKLPNCTLYGIEPDSLKS